MHVHGDIEINYDQVTDSYTYPEACKADSLSDALSIASVTHRMTPISTRLPHIQYMLVD